MSSTLWRFELRKRALTSTRQRFQQLITGATVAALLAGASVGVSAAPAWATKTPVIPSQSQIDQANAHSAAKAVEIGQTEAELAVANASLSKLNNAAEAAVEKYDGATVKLQTAEQAAAVAQAAVVKATKAWQAADRQFQVVASASYRGQSQFAALAALFDAKSPDAYESQASALSAVARQQRGVILTMAKAQKVRAAAQDVAAQAVAVQRGASDAAGRAKNAALTAMNDQTNQVRKIQGNQADLQAQLAVLKGTAKNLAQARQAGLAELAAQAAAAAAAARRQIELARQAEEAAQASGNGSTSGGDSFNVVPPGTGFSVSTASQRATAISYAESKIGIWYRWAGAGEIGPTETSNGIQNIVGYDCSGLTMRAYGAAGIALLHYTGDQWNEGMHVSQSQLIPGDLVFFATNIDDPNTIHHVGLYIGGGLMIDAPETGDQIRVDNAFRPDYIGAVQP